MLLPVGFETVLVAEEGAFDAQFNACRTMKSCFLAAIWRNARICHCRTALSIYNNTTRVKLKILIRKTTTDFYFTYLWKKSIVCHTVIRILRGFYSWILWKVEISKINLSYVFGIPVHENKIFKSRGV